MLQGQKSSGQPNQLLANTRRVLLQVNVTEDKSQQSQLPLILLIENDDEDIFFFRRAIAKLNWRGDVRVVGSAIDARIYMQGGFPFDDRVYYRLPQLIFSDYRLAGHTALEFFAWLRSQPEFAELPVVMLSGVASGLDAEKLTRVGAKGFVQKTGDINKLAAALKPFLPPSATT